ncbi:MAG: CpaF family protein, partial [Hyphococcus sp.]
MFGRRTAPVEAPPAPKQPAKPQKPAAAAAPAAKAAPRPAPKKAAAKPAATAPAPEAPPRVAKVAASTPEQQAIEIGGRSDEYFQTKTTIFNALIDTIDLSQLAQLDTESAAEEIRDIVNEIISIKNVQMSIAEQESLLQDICNDVLGYGPLEPLL